jgi:hypothetical protein
LRFKQGYLTHQARTATAMTDASNLTAPWRLSVHRAIKLIVDNHSAHISKETIVWIVRQPAHRFEFTFMPTQAP